MVLSYDVVEDAGGGNLSVLQLGAPGKDIILIELAPDLSQVVILKGILALNVGEEAGLAVNNQVILCIFDGVGNDTALDGGGDGSVHIL